MYLQAENMTENADDKQKVEQMGVLTGLQHRYTVRSQIWH